MKLQHVIQEHLKEVLTTPNVSGADILRAVNMWLAYDDLILADDYEQAMNRIERVLELLKKEYS